MISIPQSGIALSIGPVSTPVGTCAGIGSCFDSVSASTSGSHDTGLLDPALLPPAAFDPGGFWLGATIHLLLESTAYDLSGVAYLIVSQNPSRARAS